ncbi:MAG: 3'-5' exonuclease, partial [Armatimonadaceae bacterium]
MPSTLEVDSRQEDAVLLTTLHAAKGREFGLVVLPDLNHSVFPPQSRGFRLPFAPHESDLEEEKRLFFVGLSRAKDSVLVSYIDGRGKKKSTLLDSLRVVTDRFHWKADDVLPSISAPLREAESMMVDVRELVRWQRCSAQSVYERGTFARGTADSGYPLFHATIVASLHSDNPSEAFDRLWSERSRPVPEPLRAYYRHLAKRHVGDCEGPLLFGGPIERVVDVGNGMVTVRADGMDRDGRPVRVRIKRALNRPASSNDLTDF